MRELPDGWVEVPLETLLIEGPTNGYSPAITANATGTLSLKLSATTTGRFILNDKTTKRLSEHIPPDSKLWLIHNDILVQRANTLEYVGTAAIYNGPPNTYVYPDLMMRIRPADTIADSAYLCRYINSTEAKEHLRAKATGTSGNMPKINGSTLRELPILLPPLPEQRRIVEKLEDLLARSRRAKEALDAIPPLLEKLRQSVLAAAFRGDLTADWRAKNPNVEPAEALLARIRVERRKAWEVAELAKMKAKGKAPGDDRWKEKYVEPEPVDASELPELPEGWCWAAWREIGFSQNGRPFPSSAYAKTGVRLLRPGNLHVSGFLLWTEENTRYLPDSFCAENPTAVIGPNELLMNLTAQSLKDEFLGRVCMSSIGERCLLNQRIARLTPILLPPRFFLWQFKSPLVRRYIDKLNSGSLIQHMFTSQVEDFALAIPPLSEQDEITRRIEQHLMTLEAAGVAAQTSARIKQLEAALLAKAFRGELVPQDPNDEPASVMLARLRQASSPAAPARGPSRGRKRAAT